MSSTQFRVKLLIFFARFSVCLAIVFYCRFHNFFEWDRLALRLKINPARLNRSTKGATFNDLKSDSRETENVSDDLAHTCTLGATAGNAQFFGFDPETNQAVHPLRKADHDSL